MFEKCFIFAQYISAYENAFFRWGWMFEWMEVSEELWYSKLCANMSFSGLKHYKLATHQHEEME